MDPKSDQSPEGGMAFSSTKGNSESTSMTTAKRNVGIADDFSPSSAGSSTAPASTKPSQSQIQPPSQYQSISDTTKAKPHSRASSTSSTVSSVPALSASTMGRNKIIKPSSSSTKQQVPSEESAPMDNDLLVSVMKSSSSVASSITKSSNGSGKDDAKATKKMRNNKKRKNNMRRSKAETRRGASQDPNEEEIAPKKPGPKKGKRRKDEGVTTTKTRRKKKSNFDGIQSPAQRAVKDMMHNLLEEDKYSVQGSIVDTDSSDEEDDDRIICAVSGGEATMIHLDRSVIARAARKRLRIEGMRGVMDTSGSRKRANSIVIMDENGDGANSLSANVDGYGNDVSTARAGRKKKRKKGKRGGNRVEHDDMVGMGNEDDAALMDASGGDAAMRDAMCLEAPQVLGDESSIFGQTTGSSNSTWVECDKCKKWRRLRGIVDAKKLPLKWYCSMNKNDPERAKCSAPEEEYEAPITPETLTDQRARKHLRLWVRRLQCNENFESRMPTMTRGKRRNATSAKDPYEWVRCCNPSCGKWRALLRSMDAASVMESARNGEWYCVLNTWDEKTASCAAPQENLPAIGCPPWVMQNEE